MYNVEAKLGLYKSEKNGTYQTMILMCPITNAYELSIRKKYYGDWMYVVGVQDEEILHQTIKNKKYMEAFVKLYEQRFR